jgi:glyoxylase-like metal-dependent hydrolase (beta-lactamase superfamily II)
VDRELADDEVLDELGASVVSTPGHTDGSIALHFHEAGALFTNDVATEQAYVILGPFNHDRAKARESFRRFADIDVDIDGRDNPEELVTTALRAQTWTCVIVGVGLRKAEDELVLFERIVNLVREHAPGAAIAFNATVPEFYEAAARWIDVPEY